PRAYLDPLQQPAHRRRARRSGQGNRRVPRRYRAPGDLGRILPDAAGPAVGHRARRDRSGDRHQGGTVDPRRHFRRALPQGPVPGDRLRPAQRDDAQARRGRSTRRPRGAGADLSPHRAVCADGRAAMTTDAADIARGAAPIGHGRLQWRILLGFLFGLIAGLAAYTLARDAAWVAWIVTYVTGPIGQVFLRLLFMLVLPLLFAALVVGIAEMGEIRELKAIGLRTLAYTVVVSSIAVAISLAAVNLLRPGDGVDPAAARELLAQGGEGAASIVQASVESQAGVNALLAIVPSNVVQAMSNNDILAVMFFALFFGIGLLLVQTRRTAVLKDAIEGVFEVAMKLIGLVIQLAPIAIFCFMFNLSAQFGWDLLFKLAAFVGVVLLALGLQMFGVFPALLRLIAGKSPIAFFRET